MKNKILTLLRESDSYRSGEEMSSLLQVSRTTIWKYIRQLRKEGYQIKAITNKGYQLSGEADLLNEQVILDALEQNGLADWIEQVCYTDKTDSTNQQAKIKAGYDVWGRTLFITASQQAGRGRKGRLWFTEPDLNLTFSLLSRPSVTPQDIAPVTLFAGLCTALALNAYMTQRERFETACLPSKTGQPGEIPRISQNTGNQVITTNAEQLTLKGKIRTPVGIKWPNDLVSANNGKKIGGVLIETILEENRVEALIIGIGINLNSQDFSDDLQSSATSVLLETGCVSRRLDVLCHILQTLRRYETIMTSRQTWLPLYRSLCLTLNRPVRILGQDGREQRAQAIDIDLNGELVIINDHGKKQTVRSGEVSVRGLLGYTDVQAT